jgi:hypothetical protein
VARRSTLLAALGAAAALGVIAVAILWQGASVGMIDRPKPSSSQPSAQPTAEGTPAVGPNSLRLVESDLVKPARIWNGTTTDAEVQTESQETVVIRITGDGAQGAAPGWARIEYVEPASGEWVFGWLRPADAATLVPSTTHRCPNPDVAHVLSATPAEAHACFGTDSFHLTPIHVHAAPQPARYKGEPAWLATPSRTIAEFSPEGDSGALPIHFSPEAGVQAVPDGWYAIDGHFSDPASAACVRTPMIEPYRPETTSEQALWCEQQFVVTRITPTNAPPQ